MTVVVNHCAVTASQTCIEPPPRPSVRPSIGPFVFQLEALLSPPFVTQLSHLSYLFPSVDAFRVD